MMKLLARLLPELYSTRSNYYYLSIFLKNQDLSRSLNNKTQTAVTNICLNCIPFMNLTIDYFTSSEVIIIQLQINLNSKIQPYGLGTNEID